MKTTITYPEDSIGSFIELVKSEKNNMTTGPYQEYSPRQLLMVDAFYKFNNPKGISHSTAAYLAVLLGETIVANVKNSYWEDLSSTDFTDMAITVWRNSNQLSGGVRMPLFTYLYGKYKDYDLPMYQCFIVAKGIQNFTQMEFDEMIKNRAI